MFNCKYQNILQNIVSNSKNIGNYLGILFLLLKIISILIIILL